jgi:hypothetical protein
VGAVAIEGTSYVDMLLRGRPASELPGHAVRAGAAKAGLNLGPEGSDAARNRSEAIGALLGYGTGVALGCAYGLVVRGHPGGRLRGLALGAAAMVPGNLPVVASGLTDPRTWGVSGWLADIVPHLAYGFATAAAYRAIVSEPE